MRRITLVKWISIGLLLLTLLFSSSFSEYGLTVELLVGISAVVVGLEALREKRGRWVAAYLLVALYFVAAAASGIMSPLSPAVRINGIAGALAIVASMAVFGLSFFTMRAQPRLSMASIADRTPGSEAL